MLCWTQSSKSSYLPFFMLHLWLHCNSNSVNSPFFIGFVIIDRQEVWQEYMRRQKKRSALTLHSVWGTGMPVWKCGRGAPEWGATSNIVFHTRKLPVFYEKRLSKITLFLINLSGISAPSSESANQTNYKPMRWFTLGADAVKPDSAFSLHAMAESHIL